MVKQAALDGVSPSLIRLPREGDRTDAHGENPESARTRTRRPDCALGTTLPPPLP